MVIIFLLSITLVFVFVVAYLLMQQKDNRVFFYDELKKEDKKEINQILDDEENSKFKIVDKVE